MAEGRVNATSRGHVLRFFLFDRRKNLRFGGPGLEPGQAALTSRTCATVANLRLQGTAPAAALRADFSGEEYQSGGLLSSRVYPHTINVRTDWKNLNSNPVIFRGEAGNGQNPHP